MDGLVDFVLGIEAASLPPAVLDGATRSMTDWLGTAIRGSARTIVELTSRNDRGCRRASAGHRGRSRPARRAVRVARQRLQSHALDFDDVRISVHRPRRGAPSRPSSWDSVSGFTFQTQALAAFVAGFEVETRLGRVIGRALADQGMARHRRARTFRSGGRRGKAARSQCHATRARARYRGTQAAGLGQSFGTMSKPLHPGRQR
jgi:hypothetical protein